MIEPGLPSNEAERLVALDRYQILDTLPEQVYDDLVSLAAHIAGTPIALVSLIDEHRQWFKARCGLDATETPRSISFCGHAVESGGPLVVEDARLDERFADNPIVVGDPHVIFYAGSPITTEDGFMLGTLCVIDHRPREFGEAHRRMLDALARQVMSQLELRRELQRRSQLIAEVDAARKEAERANAAKSAFLAVMSHELRTPLNSILGFTKLLARNKEHNLSKTQLEYLERARTSGVHLLSVIQDVLDLSKIEAAQLELQWADVDLGALVREVAAEVEAMAAATGTQIQVACPDHLQPIPADVRRLRQVLLNLIGNAVKFAAGGCVCIRVTTDGASREPARIEVQDNGIGIAEEAQGAVFDTFQQVDSSPSRPHEGSGLGLAIARRLCEAHGFTLNLVSAENSGSLFWVGLLPGAAIPSLRPLVRE